MHIKTKQKYSIDLHIIVKLLNTQKLLYWTLCSDTTLNYAYYNIDFQLPRLLIHLSVLP